jgi:hypothetical protein
VIDRIVDSILTSGCRGRVCSDGLTAAGKTSLGHELALGVAAGPGHVSGFP